MLLSSCSPVIKTGVGFGYVDNIPQTHLTGHEQFRFRVAVEQPIHDNMNLVIDWNHWSNGAGLGIGRLPNYGLDFYSAYLEGTWGN